MTSGGAIVYMDVKSNIVTIDGNRCALAFTTDVSKRRQSEAERRELDSRLRQSEKMAAMVQDLLTLARRGVAVSQVTNLNEIVTDYLSSAEHRKLREEHPAITLRVALDEDLLNIHGSPVHLSKTVMNLVSNAAEATLSGTGTIVITTRNQYVNQPIRGYDEVTAGDYAVLSVTDDGMGIAPEDITRIFEPFYSRKVMGRRGTGLGMAVVWGTVKDHHGYIDVSSCPDRGTTLELYLPVTRESLVNPAGTADWHDLSGAGERLLVVDDLSEQREITSRILTRLGYSVATVSSGKAALAYLSENHADLLILDMIMDPEMDGLDTFREVLRMRPGQKAIITSGFSESERVRQARQLGARRYLKKPYSLESIGAAVKAELRS